MFFYKTTLTRSKQPNMLQIEFENIQTVFYGYHNALKNITVM